MTFASRNLTLDSQSQQESHVKWTSLCIEPNAKSLKMFNPQSQPKMPSDSLCSKRNTGTIKRSLDRFLRQLRKTCPPYSWCQSKSNFAVAYDHLVEVTRSKMLLPAASPTRPTFAEISPAADFAPSMPRPCLRASSLTALLTPSATLVARSVWSAANSAAFAFTVSLVSPR